MKTIKSAFPPMRPSVTLSVSPEAPPKPQPAVPPPKGPKPKGKATITVELWLEIINKPGKICPAWAYLSHEPRRLVAVLNAAHWPAAAALERKDVQAIRWLAATALLDRLALAGNDPVGRSLLRTICQLVIGPDWQWYQAGLWCAYLLKDHPLLAPIDTTLPILAGSGGGLAKFGELSCLVDPEALEAYVQKFPRKKPKEIVARPKPSIGAPIEPTSLQPDK
jgi:hypothetical protein